MRKILLLLAAFLPALSPLAASAQSALSSSSFAQRQSSPSMDRPLGYDSLSGRGAGVGMESEMTLSTSDPSGQRDRINRAMGITNSPLGAAYGNLISIQTSPGSAVELNAEQVNTGNQIVTINGLRGIGGRRYQNVEAPPSGYPANQDLTYVSP